MNQIDTAAFYFSALRSANELILDVVNLRKLPSVTSIADHFGALAELRKAGMIRHLGISAVQSGHLAETLAAAPVVCAQNPYSAGAKPEAHAFLRECAELGVAFVPFFAIASRGRAGEAASAGTGDPDHTRAGAGRAAGEMFGSRSNPVARRRAADVTFLEMQRAFAALSERDRSTGGPVNRPTAQRGPWLVCRRHIDQMRVSSAICRAFC